MMSFPCQTVLEHGGWCPWFLLDSAMALGSYPWRRIFAPWATYGLPPLVRPRKSPRTEFLIYCKSSGRSRSFLCYWSYDSSSHF